MVKKKRASSLDVRQAMDFLNQLLADKPILPFVIPLFLVVWGIEKWIFSLTNWVPLTVAVWAVFQYGSYQRKILAEDLNKKWMQVLLETSPTTPLEQCEWLNKLLIEIWPTYMSPRLSLRFSSIVERRMKQRKPKLIEKIELQEFSLGSKPPLLGLRGIRWSTSGDQRIVHLGFDWDTTDISIMLLAKLGKPLMGTARIVINSIHIKGDLRLVPVLDGRAFLYSFVAPPEVRIGVAFGSGGSQSLPATELPGVSAWLVKLVNDSLSKRMVEPRRNCFSLPAVNLFKRAVAGVLSVTVMSASKLSRSNLRSSPSRKQSSSTDGYVENLHDYKDLRTFVEVELEELTRKTDVRPGSCPRWDSKFNMTLHEDAGTIKFNLFECTPGSVKYDYLTSCEIKMRYVADDSTIFWATGADSAAIARRAEFCGKEIEMTVPFEGINSGELTVKLVLKEWQFADGSHSSNGLPISSQHSLNGTSSFLPRTGRKIYVTIVEGKDLPSKDKFGKPGSGCYVKFQYGKALKRTKTVPHTSDPTWNQKFEFDEIGGGEYLKIKCFIEEMFGDENIGSARVSLEGLIEGSPRDVWIPLEKVNSGELRFYRRTKSTFEKLRSEMDPKLKEVSQFFERFKAAFVRNDFGVCTTLLSQLKVLLTEFKSLPPLFQETPNAIHELTIARDIYEHAVVLSVKMEDQDAFERDFFQLKSYYTDARGRLPPSPQEYPILGLNLLRLLVQNRIAEFHTELELLSQNALNNPCIKHAVELEQSFMEGAYHRVLSARQTVPDANYAYFMDLLAKTVRDEIAGCSEKAYDRLSTSDARQMLLFSSDQELLEYVREEHPEWEIKDGFIVFQKVKDSVPCKEIPSLQLITQTLSYARELERIV